MSGANKRNCGIKSFMEKIYFRLHCSEEVSQFQFLWQCLVEPAQQITDFN